MNLDTWLKNLKKEDRPDEFESKALLSSRGIPVPRGRLFSPEEIENGPWQDPGLTFPCVAKVCDPDILHKTDRGGVELGLTAGTWRDSVTALSARFPGSNILMEEQLKYRGTEFIIGALVDPLFGPAVMFGAGGILTELYKDVTFRLAPLDEDEARRMLTELTISEVLQGYRGSVMDLESLAAIVAGVSRIVADLGSRFSQLDINPIVFDGRRWVALDAVLVVQGP